MNNLLRRWFNAHLFTFNYSKHSLFFKVSINKTGEINEMETKRYIDMKNLETRVIKLSDYREMNEGKLPAVFEVLWRIDKGEFSYAKFVVTEVEYDKPEKF